MPSTILSPSTLPPLAFRTPVPSPDLLSLRRRNRGANDPPPLLKRKRTAPSSYYSTPEDADASFLPTNTNLPFLDCENFGNGLEAPSHGSPPSSPLPSVKLHPRTKRSRLGCFVSSSSQEQDNQERNNTEVQTRSESNSTPVDEESIDEEITNADADFTNPLRRASSSKSMISKRSSVNLTRSLSLQLNISLNNLAAAATNSNDFCPLSASTSSIMPKRKSLLQMRTSSSSNEIQNQDSNHRRSPVATTLDYLATAIRFPDVGIGLSI